MRINLKYADVGTFIERYAVNVSRGGVFIPARTPRDVGTLVRFEFLLAGGTPVLRGEGQVIWVKPYDPAQPRRVHGMGLRFTRLDPDSRQVLEQVLAWKRDHQEETGEPRQEEEVAAVVTEPSLPNAAPPAADARGERSVKSGEAPRPAPPVSAVTPAAPAPEPPPAETSQATPQAPLALDEEPAARPPAATPAGADRDEREQREAVAELMQTSQSQVIRAARTIALMTVAQHYYPEDTVLEALLSPLRIPLPATGEDAERLLGELLRRGRWAQPDS